MRHSTKVSLALLLVCVAWFGLTDPVCAALFPHTFSTINLLKDWFFAASAALTIKLALSAEEERRNRAEAELQDSAIRDPLTNLLNRRAFFSHLEAAIERARRSDVRLGVAFLDLDNFKAANDLFGHAFGDAVLRAVAGRLRGLLRRADIAARLGGDEFAIVIEPSDGDSMEKLVHRLLAAFRAPIIIDGFSHDVTVSVGVAHYPDQGDLPEQLLRAADAAMYKAKESGRNGLAVAGTSTDVMALSRRSPSDGNPVLEKHALPRRPSFRVQSLA